jgi:hypothetical protein
LEKNGDALAVVRLHENGHRSNSGIKGLGNSGIEGILSILIYLFYPLIPQSLNA